MCQNHGFIQRIIACIFILSLFLSSCANLLDPVIPQQGTFTENVVVKGAIRSDYFKVINSKYDETNQLFQFKSYGNRHILHTSFKAKKYLDKDYKPFDSKKEGLEMVMNAFQQLTSKIEQESLRAYLGYMTESLPKQAGDLITKRYKDVKIEQYKAVDHYRDYVIAAITNSSFPKVELKWDDKKGWGVYALEKIPVGAVVGIYAGEIMTMEANLARNKERGYQNNYVAYINEELCIDAEVHGNFTRFMNHASKVPKKNTVSFLIRLNKVPYVVFTSHNIENGQEITWNYGAIPFKEE